MPLRFKYKIIAAFFLTVFSLNTAAGFACSIGIDMGYNSHHHGGEKKSKGKKHDHGSGHNHDKKHDHSQKHEPSEKSSKDDCCSNDVTAFNRLDKSVSTASFILNPPVSLIAFSFFTYIVAVKADETKNKSSVCVFRRCCSFNDIDVRIAIQSFQI